jgi:short-subunit dehydrogenase
VIASFSYGSIELAKAMRNYPPRMLIARNPKASKHQMEKNHMLAYKGKWALITGASSGIGEEFARRLAQAGVNLILTARREQKLKSLADELKAAHFIRAETITADLSLPEAPAQLFRAVGTLGVPVSVLINNAGFGIYGRLHETSPEESQRLIMTNVHALSSLTHFFLPAMVEARDGYIFNIASTAAFQPVPYMANYAASKAFVLSYSVALWAEYKKQGVRVLAVCPGATETPFFEAMGAREPAIGHMDTVQNVVNNALAAMEKGRCSVVSGPLSNHVLSQLNRISPRALVAIIGEMLLRPRRKPAA